MTECRSLGCVLLVEDDERDVFLFQRILSRAGVKNPVQVVFDGEMAIDYLSGVGAYSDRKRHPLPCLVLLDWKMPKLGGLEVLKWIRSQPELKMLVVIVLSSSASPANVERAYQLGANSYLEKPIEAGKIEEVARGLQTWWLKHNEFPEVREAHRTPQRRGKAA